MEEHLFAYGTLIHGGPPAVEAAMRRFTTPAGSATVAGRLFDAGAWPALLPPLGPADRVPGILFRVDDPRALWPVLDAWEGCGASDPTPHLFERMEQEARPARAGPVVAWLYRFLGDARGWPQIDRWPPAVP